MMCIIILKEYKIIINRVLCLQSSNLLNSSESPTAKKHAGDKKVAADKKKLLKDKKRTLKRL
jgi:hypothetical protein